MSKDPSLILWVFSFLALGSALVAALVNDVKRSALALWICGLSVGGVFLTLGAEFLAIVQWIVATLVSLSFIFYSVLFGAEPRKQNRLFVALSFALGLGLVVAVWLGLPPAGSQVEISLKGQSLEMFGKALIERHLLSVEILALTLFLVIVGAGTLARPEVKKR